MNSPYRIVLTIVLLASAGASLRAGEAQPRYLDAIPIFQCEFGEDWDVNYDGWPDRWRRENGPDYPHYVEMGIAEDPGVKPGRCLQIKLDGARARVFSPPIRVLPKFSYQLELKLKTTGLEHSQVTIVLDFMTASGEVVQTHRSEPFGQTKGWIDIKIDKVRPMFPNVDRAVARVEVERGDRGDLNGVVSLADLWLSRWPSMEVTTNSRFNVYDDPDNVVITCSLAGIAEQQPIIKFQLLDATQTELLKEGAVGMKTLAGRIISEESRQTSEMIDGDGKHSDGYEGSTQWEPNIRDNGEYGFYRVHVSMISKNGGVMDQRTITLAVVPKEIKSSIASNIKPSKGEFGWSLPESVPRFGKPLDFATLQELLPLAGVSWVKVPVWFPREEQARGDEIIQFAERLAATDIETVGIIQSPEKWESGSDSGSEGSDIEFIFRKDPSSWLPLFDHVMNRLSLRLRWWQLGYDHDTSFVGYEDLEDKVAEIRRQLYRFGQDIRLGIGWRWNEAPLEGNQSWDYEQLSANPMIRSDQLDEKLATRPAGAAPRWVLIEPVLDVEDTGAKSLQEQHEARVREFIKQIVVAKKHGVQGVFVSHPFSGPMGVMSEDGTPGELLLPWRTAATLLGGARYIGSLQLPNQSKNWLFLRQDRQVVMVIWNELPTEEVLYLGDNIERYDVWGKSEPLEHREHRQVVPVGPQPAFILGVNEAVARWRMSVRFERDAIPSVFGVEHANALNFHNAFPMGVGGTISLFVSNTLKRAGQSPDEPSKEWKIFPEVEEIKSAAGLDMRHPIQIELNEAAFGIQPIRIDFDLNSHKYKFSVWRSLQVGLGDVDIQAITFLDRDGRLVVQQKMVNMSGKPADFKCTLSAYLRPRKRTQVFQLGPEPDLKSYAYSRGKELLGEELKLQIEEIDGDRVLIYRFLAKPESDVRFEETNPGRSPYLRRP